LFRYIQAQGPGAIFQCRQILSVPFKKQPKEAVGYMSEGGTALPLSAPDQGGRKGRRGMALLCLLYDSAARVQELADLKVKNIRLSVPAQVALIENYWDLRKSEH
jgi:site-specific recombinase XerD